MLTFLLISMLFKDDLKVMPGTPISPESWDVSAEIDKYPTDAVVLEDTTVFQQAYTLRFRRVRILNENGKSAAEFVDPEGKFIKVRGRVVDRSGEETVIELAEDLVEVLAFKSRGDRVKAKILVPPGLTSDCVVEMSWQEPVIDGLPEGVYSKRFYVQEPWPIRSKIINLTPSALRTESKYLVSRFVWNESLGKDHFKVEKPSKYAILLTYSNIPPLYKHPYGNHHLDRNAAYALLFKSFDYGNEVDEFYENFAKRYIKPDYTGRFKRSKDYKKWIGDLKKSLPEDHLKAMVKVYNAFRDRIAITDLLPAAKRAQITKELSKQKSADQRMSEVFKLGYGNPADLGFLFYRVAMDCEIPFKLMYASSINGPPFQPMSFNPFMLLLYYPFFGIELSPNQWVVFTPQWQENAAGFLPTHYQGGTALVVDPYDKFKHSFTRTPRYGAKSHQRIREYTTKISADGTIDMAVEMFGNGTYDAREKNRYYPLPADEQEETLRRYWQDRLTSWEILKATVSIPNLKARVKTRVEARLKQDLEETDWLAIDPFPGGGVPLANPSVWPPNRHQPIMLPHCSTQIGVNKITVPDGWKLKGNPSWTKANSFGSVKLTASQAANVIEIRKEIVIAKDVFPPEKEKELKFFIAWVHELADQNIGIDMGGA